MKKETGKTSIFINRLFMYIGLFSSLLLIAVGLSTSEIKSIQYLDLISINQDWDMSPQIGEKHNIIINNTDKEKLEKLKKYYPYTKRIIQKPVITSRGVVSLSSINTEIVSTRIVSQIGMNSYVKITYSREHNAFLVKVSEIEVTNKINQRIKTDELIIGKINLPKGVELIKINEKFISTKYESSYNIDLKKLLSSKIEAYIQLEENILLNESTSRTYSSVVNDCSSYMEGEPKISGTITNNRTNFEATLKSENHFACLNEIIRHPFNPDLTYIMSLQYENLIGSSIRIYHELYKYPDKTNKSRKLFEERIEKNRVYNYLSDLQIEDGYDEMSIFVYAPSYGDIIENKYSNLQISTYKYSEDLKFEMETEIPKIHKNETVTNIDINENDFYPVKISENLLVPNQEQFDTLWIESIQNCNKKDFPDALVDAQIYTTDNNKSLKVKAENGLACAITRINTDVDPSKIYKLKFRAKGKINDTLFVSAVIFNPKERLEKLRYQNIRLKEKFTVNDWKDYEFILVPEIENAERVYLYFYAEGVNTVSEVYFDDVSLSQHISKNVEDISFEYSTDINNHKSYYNLIPRHIVGAQPINIPSNSYTLLYYTKPLLPKQSLYYLNNSLKQDNLKQELYSVNIIENSSSEAKKLFIINWGIVIFPVLVLSLLLIFIINKWLKL